jgi:hypothetical protein
MTTDSIERTCRVYSMLIPQCPLCGAEVGETCLFLPEHVNVQLDRENGVLAHPERVIVAVRSGLADKASVVAQFGENMPWWVREL